MRKMLEIKRIKNNIMTIIRGSFTSGQIELNDLGDMAITRIDRKFETPSADKYPELSKEQKKQIRTFYKPYVCFISDSFHRIYTSVSGNFDVRYMPEDFYFTTIDKFYTNRQQSKLYANKTLFYETFAGMNQPGLVAIRQKGVWKNKEGKVISQEQLKEVIEKESQVVLKQAECSEGGNGVYFLEGKNRFEDLKKISSKTEYDFVVQNLLKQHPDIERLHPGSVNTIRVVSLYTEGNTKVYSAAIKVGIGSSRTDNGKSGGIYVGIHPDGSLKKAGCTTKMQRITRHPDLGYPFEEQRIPSFDKVVSFVQEAHNRVPMFRLVAWDIAIDQQGNPAFIEANYSLGGINELQICNGPLFGEDTKIILDEVFSHRKRRLFVFL